MIDDTAAMKTYFRVLIPSSNRVGAGTMKTFRTLKEAQQFLKEKNAEGVGKIEEVNEAGKLVHRVNRGQALK